jgi:hypothetical protein
MDQLSSQAHAIGINEHFLEDGYPSSLETSANARQLLVNSYVDLPTSIITQTQWDVMHHLDTQARFSSWWWDDDEDEDGVWQTHYAL